MRTAIIQCADTGPLESLVMMLEAVGWECLYPSSELLDELRHIGCDTVLPIERLVKGMGYQQPTRRLTARLDDMQRSDVVYVDVKAHRNGPIVWKHWPNLKKRTLWYRINGGKPEHVIRADGFDCGNEFNPPCPVLTPNRWYAEQWIDDSNPGAALAEVMDEADYSRFYSCWPPFARVQDYSVMPRDPCEKPLCLIHNVAGWGYERLLRPLSDEGVKFYGDRSPDGLLQNRNMPGILARALCMVHLKSSDAPGYALYEALAAGCPVVCTRRLIWRCRMQDLLIPNETCLVFDRETHDGLTDKDVVECTNEVKGHINRLSDLRENLRIGMQGRERLHKVMWSPTNASDVGGLRKFLSRFG